MSNVIININDMRFTLPKKFKKYRKGQTLINILVAIAIFSLLTHALFTLVNVSYRFTNFNRARIAARHLAQEKMELIRNLPYDNVGTSGGIPDGPLPQQEVVRRNSLNYTIETDIIYIDDPFDDTAPDDTLATDYKRVRVEVSWGGISSSSSNPVVLVTDVAPNGVESTEGGGTLSILVFDASGEPIPQADVSIDAPSEGVDLDMQTGDNGRIILPGAPICNSCYEITATKSGFSTDRTYSTSEVANPNKPHQTVLEGELTEVSFAIDTLSTVDLATFNDRDSDFSTFANATIRIRGSKTIGTNTDGDLIYKYDQEVTTDSSGNLQLTDIEWDTYELLPPSSDAVSISGSNPYPPLVIDPDSTYDLSVALTTFSTHNLLTIITDSNDVPIASASVTLESPPTYEETILSGASSNPDLGQSFFPSLSSQEYTLSATASGYLDTTGDVTVSGNTKEKIIMNPE